MVKRPLAVTMISWVYIAAGSLGIAYHLSDFRMPHPFQFDPLGIAFIRLLAIVSGTFMLRGHNWARWLALAWIGFHVILSAFHTLTELAIHSLFFGILAFLLFRPASARYFQGGKAGREAKQPC